MRPLKYGLCPSTRKIVVDEPNIGHPHVEDPIFHQHVIGSCIQALALVISVIVKTLTMVLSLVALKT
jgi:hypothetical protein